MAAVSGARKTEESSAAAPTIAKAGTFETSEEAPARLGVEEAPTRLEVRARVRVRGRVRRRVRGRG